MLCVVLIRLYTVRHGSGWKYVLAVQRVLVGAHIVRFTSALHTVRGNTVCSVGRVPDSWSQGLRFESHQECGVVSLSKTLHLHCFVLVQPMKTSQHDSKIVIGTYFQPQPKQRSIRWECATSTTAYRTE